MAIWLYSGGMATIDACSGDFVQNMMLENYNNLLIGYQLTKPDIIFKLEREGEPWDVEEEMLWRQSED